MTRAVSKKNRKIAEISPIPTEVISNQLIYNLTERLKEMQEIQQALDQTSEIMITDPEGAILSVNDKFISVCGYTRKELIGKNPRLFKSGFHPESFYKDLWLTLKRGEIWKGEIKNRHKSGRFYWMDTTIFPLSSSDGKLTKFIAIRYDVSQRKELEALREEFISIASHELKSPITLIKMVAENLSEGLYGALSPLQKEAVLKLKKNIDLLSSTALNLLDISRIESGQSNPKFVHLNACEALSQIVSDFKSIAEEHRIELQMKIPTDSSVLCMDPDMLRQVVSNLLSNAFRFANKKIIARARKVDQGIQLSIIDDGPGIPQQEVENIFKKFAHLEQPASRIPYKGTGLGLAICKDIIEGPHRGKIWVENGAGGGAAFHFLLPLLCKCNP